jgi:hypothetical protein
MPSDWMFRPSQTVPHGKRAPVSDDDDDVTEASAQAAKKPRVIASDSEDEVWYFLAQCNDGADSWKASLEGIFAFVDGIGTSWKISLNKHLLEESAGNGGACMVC